VDSYVQAASLRLSAQSPRPIHLLIVGRALPCLEAGDLVQGCCARTWILSKLSEVRLQDMLGTYLLVHLVVYMGRDVSIFPTASPSLQTTPVGQSVS
jgi:hypothetical protein